MSPEMIAILAVGVALAGLMVQGQRGLNNSLGRRIDEVSNSLGKRIESLEKRMDGFEKRMDGFDERLRALETSQAELKGLILGKLDFIERYIIARNLQASEASPEPGGADE